jgi:excinuclease ABC subunit A
MRDLILKGVRQNNLKDIDLSLPLGKAIIITGPSGSGKSSLAFDTIYAEGQRRYMQSLSTYARQFLEKFKAPLVDKMQNIPPTIALEQLNPVRNSRTTVGTTTEIYDYLRLLFEKLGTEYCPDCNLPMEKLTYNEIFEKIVRDFEGQTILIAFSKTLPPTKEVTTDFLREMLRSGYSRLVHKHKVEAVEDLIKAGAPNGKSVDIVIDRIRLPDVEEALSTLQARIGEAVRNAMGLGERVANILTENAKGYSKARDFTNQSRCPKCKRVSAPKTATSFSFNSPLGACQTCNGFGNTLELDEDKVIPSPALSLSKGAIDPFTKPSLNHWQKKLLSYCKEARIDITVPYKDLPESHRKIVIDGDKYFKGVRGVFRMLEKDKYKMRIRVFLSRYNSPFLCPDCKGARLGEGPLRVRIQDRNIAEVSEMTIEACHQFLRSLKFTERERTIAADILRQIDRRLDYLGSVGLGYLTLSRLGRSLSGGEYQRILLATQLSQGLTDTMYVLDEPSIGLHPKDTQRLITVLNRLREQGNSLVVVEHDPEVISWGEYIVDLGPGAGTRGGQIVFSGSRESFILSDTQTSRAVKEWKSDCRKALERPARDRAADWIDIRGASANNLKDIDVSIPLNRMVVITGVSGSGKSTLIVDTLYQALSKIFNSTSEKIGKFESMSGFEHLGGIELVDQSPIGKSSRSNPITFIKAYDEIRQLFSQTREAVAKRLTPGHFSFNVPGGRCEECEGEGRTKVDMVFMEDIWVPCQSCDEKRFKASILAIRYRGKNIDDCLRMTVDEAYDFFKSIPSLKAKLALLQEVGLGYIQLGQPGFSLSGGEAQRLKIARELSSNSLRRPNTLFIFDEPTTGLHFEEITKLIGVLRRLITSGHSVVVIEHNVQMICSADFLIDLGPDGGSSGGTVVAVGTPKELAQKKLPYTGLYLAEILEQ